MALSGSIKHGILPATADNIATAARLLREGELVAFPTETVYGLGADATNDRAVAAVFACKGRPRFNPLICHFPSVETARKHAVFDGRAAALAARFWPGALTLVLARHRDSDVSLLASAGLDTLAVRVPSHAIARALLAECGRPLAAPSANISGKVSPTTAQHVRQSLGDKVALILDGGPCNVGIESTIVDLSGETPVLLRYGGIAQERIVEVIGPLQTLTSVAAPRAPGMLESHYAPHTPLRINATDLRVGEVLLAFGATPIPGATMTLNLSPDGDLTEAAANLFAMLRTLDDVNASAIAVMPIPERDLGRAINDRLRRAASRDLG